MLPVRTGTILMLLIALLFGGIAVFVARVWLTGQQTQIVQQTTVVPAKVETEQVVVAKKELRFGEPLSPDFLTVVDWPKGAKPDGSFTSIADLSKDGARVVLTPMAANEPILSWKISGPGARASLSALVDEGMRAVTVNVTPTTGVAGFVLPGDRVDVLYTQSKDGVSGIDVLFQNVRVLAINQNADEKTGAPIEGRTATLELTPEDAQKLALAQSTGALTFSLRGAGSLDTAPARRIVQDELGSSTSLSSPPESDEAQVAMAKRLADLEAQLKDVKSGSSATGQVEAPTTPEDSMPSTTQITIFRGLEGSSYTVPLDANQ